MAAHSSGYLTSDEPMDAAETSSHTSAQSKASFESSARSTNDNKSAYRHESKNDSNFSRQQNSGRDQNTENEDDVNEHINAFYQAKDDLLKRRQGGR
jgi:hypothetical protein